MAHATEYKAIHQLSAAEFESLFPNEEACRTYLAKRRWPEGVTCPRCGLSRISDCGHQSWKCRSCEPPGYWFSVTVGTIFESTKTPLRIWFRVIRIMLAAEKVITARQIHQALGTGNYKTIQSLCRRIRAGLRDPEFKTLMGIVDVDETIVRGLARNRYKNQRAALAREQAERGRARNLPPGALTTD
jgi:transposase-like protein